jgi:hypothetical protein
MPPLDAVCSKVLGMKQRSLKVLGNVFFHRVGGLGYRRRTVSEDRRKVQGSEVQIFTGSLNGAMIFIYADPESNVMKSEGRSKAVS